MTDQTEQPQKTTDETVTVTDLDQFITLMADWHNRQVATVAHLKEVPPGIKIIIGEGTEAKEQRMEGDFRDGFVIGLELALNYLGALPFTAEYVDDTPTTP